MNRVKKNLGCREQIKTTGIFSVARFPNSATIVCNRSLERMALVKSTINVKALDTWEQMFTHGMVEKMYDDDDGIEDRSFH